MMKFLDSKILDLNSEVYGLSIDDLMYNAGVALAEVIEDMYKGKNILIVCGNGNNGGDGLAAAHHLNGKNITVALMSPPEKIRSEASKIRLGQIPMPKQLSEIEVNDYDVIVDCVLGTGVKGEVSEEVAEYILKVNTFVGPVLSADVPTGFGTAKAIVPDVTVTFHDIKEGMNQNNSGTIIIADIGITEEIENTVGPGDVLRYPIPDPESHKGQNGRLLIIGGGPYVGAPALAAMAAQRVGVDLVRIATPKRSFIQISSMSATFITFELSGDVLNVDDVPGLIRMSEDVDAVLIGPGLGTDEKTIDAIDKFVKTCKVPLVIDADAIGPVSKIKKLSVPAIFTPHHKELETMLKNSKTENAEGFSYKTGAVVISKGKVDKITNGHITKNNPTGCAAMTAGGTGDALAGVVAGLVSKGMEAFDAACLGAYISGIAGEYAFNDYFYGMTASDLIDNIPLVLKDHIEFLDSVQNPMRNTMDWI